MRPPLGGMVGRLSTQFAGGDAPGRAYYVARRVKPHDLDQDTRAANRQLTRS
jgi:hypothetical protein